VKSKICGAVVVTGAALTMTAAFAGSSQAEPAQGTVQQQINEVLANTEGGTQISEYEIAWNGGEAIMAFPLPGEAKARPSSPAAQRLEAQRAGVPVETVASAPLADDSCPTEIVGNDWYCFYEHDDFEGRRLQWNANHPTMVFFSDYDFINETSSWSNKGGMTIDVNGRSQSGSDESCRAGDGIDLWMESPHSRATSVSAADNDRADCFRTID
jgi:hypothetical protein